MATTIQLGPEVDMVSPVSTSAKVISPMTLASLMTQVRRLTTVTATPRMGTRRPVKPTSRGLGRESTSGLASTPVTKAMEAAVEVRGLVARPAQTIPSLHPSLRPHHRPPTAATVEPAVRAEPAVRTGRAARTEPAGQAAAGTTGRAARTGRTATPARATPAGR